MVEDSAGKTALRADETSSARRTDEFSKPLEDKSKDVSRFLRTERAYVIRGSPQRQKGLI